MRDKHYKIRHIRTSELVWNQLKLKRKASGKSWNLFLLDLLKKNDEQKKPLRSIFGELQSVQNIDVGGKA